MTNTTIFGTFSLALAKLGWKQHHSSWQILTDSPKPHHSWRTDNFEAEESLEHNNMINKALPCSRGCQPCTTEQLCMECGSQGETESFWQLYSSARCSSLHKHTWEGDSKSSRSSPWHGTNLPSNYWASQTSPPPAPWAGCHSST